MPNNTLIGIDLGFRNTGLVEAKPEHSERGYETLSCVNVRTEKASKKKALYTAQDDVSSAQALYSGIVDFIKALDPKRIASPNLFPYFILILVLSISLILFLCRYSIRTFDNSLKVFMYFCISVFVNFFSLNFFPASNISLYNLENLSPLYPFSVIFSKYFF